MFVVEWCRCWEQCKSNQWRKGSTDQDFVGDTARQRKGGSWEGGARWGYFHRMKKNSFAIWIQRWLLSLLASQTLLEQLSYLRCLCSVKHGSEAGRQTFFLLFHANRAAETVPATRKGEIGTDCFASEAEISRHRGNGPGMPSLLGTQQERFRK